MRSYGFIGVFAVSLICAQPSMALAQDCSFNCRTADKPDEVLICQSPELCKLDIQMSGTYFRLRNGLGGTARSRLMSDQAAWLRQRFNCGRDYGCVRSLYERRISELNHY
jgi:uncharacterized protein